MNDGYLWWFLLVGAVIALAVVWVVAARLPRGEGDVSDDERRAEAAWISETIERYGGVAPHDLVEEVLELHAGYLASPRLARDPGPSGRVPGPPADPATAPPVERVPPPPDFLPSPGGLPPPVMPPAAPLGRVEQRPPPAPPR